MEARQYTLWGGIPVLVRDYVEPGTAYIATQPPLYPTSPAQQVLKIAYASSVVDQEQKPNSG